MVVMRILRPQEHLRLIDQCLLGAMREGKSRSAWRTCADGPMGCALRPELCVILCLGKGLALLRFQDFIFGDCFAILCASKDCRSLMWGSDVVHCV